MCDTIVHTRLKRRGFIMRNFFTTSISFVLGLVIKVLEPIAKKTKATWDDTLIKILKLIKIVLQFGGFKK